MFFKLLIPALLTASTLALPTRLSGPSIFGRDTSGMDIILAIAPGTSSCDSAPAAGECATASTAAPFLITAMEQYSIYSPSEIASILSLILFESGDLKYNTNHFPGRPGQGTRNMQMANFNLEYALSIPELKDQAAALAPSGTVGGLSNDALNQIRALVLPDQYSFASGAWFYATKCGSVKSQVQAGGEAGFAAYMSCVGASSTPERLAYFTRARQAFGVA